MSATDQGMQVCQECGQPLLPQTTKDQPEPTDDNPGGGDITVDVQVQDVCVNQDCPRFGRPNDPFETSS
jgi:hypothetical protein